MFYMFSPRFPFVSIDLLSFCSPDWHVISSDRIFQNRAHASQVFTRIVSFGLFSAPLILKTISFPPSISLDHIRLHTNRLSRIENLCRLEFLTISRYIAFCFVIIVCGIFFFHYALSLFHFCFFCSRSGGSSFFTWPLCCSQSIHSHPPERSVSSNFPSWTSRISPIARSPEIGHIPTSTSSILPSRSILSHQRCFLLVPSGLPLFSAARISTLSPSKFQFSRFVSFSRDSPYNLSLWYQPRHFSLALFSILTFPSHKLI
jgi:hypothetical protein